MERLRGKLHRIILGIQNKNPERIAEGLKEHEAIADAVFQGKGEQAAKLIVMHLEWGKKFLVAPK
jgi:DNA-binding GntR family transcriptional regulator